MIDKYKILKRKVKHLRIEVEKEGTKLIIPENWTFQKSEILDKHKNWIEQKTKFLNEIENLSKNLEIYNHKNLEEIIQNYTEEIGEVLKVKPTKIYFRRMKKRWGSCHPERKVLIFNKFLKFLPLDLIKYVVIHEMCHLIVKNHKKEFWLLAKKLCLDFKEKEKLLAGYKVKLENYKL